MSNGRVAITVKDIKKSFFLPHHSNNSLKAAVTQVFQAKERGGTTFNALNGVSFTIEKGDFFGILGRNGSGKSTLLKIISEIYQPSSGSVEHDGRLVSFIELGVGFKSELTGRENVFLNGALLGFSKKEIEAMYDEIVSFAELEKFMDQKLKNYSSGMKVRLAFSVAIRAKADILILDEVLAVGDKSFQDKCYDYFRSLRNEGKTVVLVTHSMNAVRDFCNRAVVIENGKIIFEGLPEQAAEEYNALFSTLENPEAAGNSAVQQAEIKAEAAVGDDIEISVRVTPTETLIQPVLAILIRKGKGLVYRWVSDEDTPRPIDFEKNRLVEGKLSLQNIFPVGSYSVDIIVKSLDRSTNYCVSKNAARFTIKNTSRYTHRVLWRPKQTFVVKANE